MILSDQKSVSRITADIDQYIIDARNIGVRPVRNDRDRRNYYAIAMVLFALANRVIDLAREVLYLHGYASPDEELRYKVIFRRLYDNGLIDRQMREDMVALINFRNKCSHHFYALDPDDLGKVFSKLHRMEEFTLMMKEEMNGFHHRRVRSIAIVACIIVIILIILIFHG